ncbi:hypothetical protein [Paenibacillus taiwanensis]|uniref:hypothetical protein n=1 Tax=Paenibacillus taiwanensis TaxID=401638 RepID=UPI00041D8105|nr:hypothetical protein [Paenibacillus taiwanensis]
MVIIGRCGLGNGARAAWIRTEVSVSEALTDIAVLGDNDQLTKNEELPDIEM